MQWRCFHKEIGLGLVEFCRALRPPLKSMRAASNFCVVISKASCSSANVSNVWIVFWSKSWTLVLASAFFSHVAVSFPIRLLRRRCSSTAVFVPYQQLSRPHVRSCSFWMLMQLPQHLSFRRSPDSRHDLQELRPQPPWQFGDPWKSHRGLPFV